MPSSKPKVLLIGMDDPTTWIVANHLVRHFGTAEIIIEEHVRRSAMVRNRIRKLGLARVASQIGFVLLLRPLIRRTAGRRIAEILAESGLDVRRPQGVTVHQTASMNSPQARELMAGIAPDVVVVNGTRILKPATLACVKASFINTHHGITPLYRGAHGAYWALYNNDSSNCGVTIHLVDEGIDTGNVIAQARIAPGPADNFATYPFLQIAAALPALELAVRDALAGRIKSEPIHGPSAVWYHPGFFQYVGGLLRGVK